MRRVKGFTLIELMITIAILGVIVGLAAPAMGDFLVRQRVSSQASELMLALAFARSEAVKSNSSIAVIPATNSSTGWSDGWCVGPESTMTNCAHSTRIRTFSAVSGVSVTSPYLATNPRLFFKRDGTINGDQAFKVTSTKLKATGNDARCIKPSLQGRSSMTKVTRDASCP